MALPVLCPIACSECLSFIRVSPPPARGFPKTVDRRIHPSDCRTASSLQCVYLRRPTVSQIGIRDNHNERNSTVVLARISHHVALSFVRRSEGRSFKPAERAAWNSLFVSRRAQIVPPSCARRET